MTLVDSGSETILDTGESAHFFEVAGNPVPDNARLGVVEASDGFRIRYARWDAKIKPTKGTILLLHGRTEFIEKYFETVDDLRHRGFAVLTFDWRGQGGSSRHTGNPRKGYVESYDEFGLDLEAILQNVLLPDCRAPYFALGHSMGGLIALYHAQLLSRQINRMVLCAPFIGFADLPLPIGLVRFSSSILMALGFGELFVSGGERPEERRPFQNNGLTGDADRFERNRRLMMNSGDLGLGGPTVAWTRAKLKAQEVVNDPEHFVGIRTPNLMVGAGDDAISNNRSTEVLAASMRCGSLVTLPGARHEIMQEKDRIREQLWAAFEAFVPGSSDQF